MPPASRSPSRALSWPRAAASAAVAASWRRAAAAAAVAAVVSLGALAADAAPRSRARPVKHRADAAFPVGSYDPAAQLRGLSGLFLGEGAPSTEIWGESVTSIGTETPARLTVGPFPTTVHIDAPGGTAVALEVRRVTGGLPDVLWAQDAEGRTWTPWTSRDARTLRVEAIPVPAEGGIDVILTPTRTGRCVVDVVATTRPIDPGDPGQGFDGNSPWAPGVLVATPRDGVPCDPLAALGLDIVQEGDGFVVVGVPEDRFGFEWADAAYLESICGDGFGFEPDAYAEPPEGSQTNQAVVGSEFGRQYPFQPGLRTIRVPPKSRRLDGTGSIIAVLDTGVDPAHPRFAGRLLPGFDFVDGDDEPWETANGIDDDRDGNPDDGYGHGTLVAGIALAVAPNARILPIRVLDDEGLGTASRVADGVRRATSQGAHVINLSLGTRAWSSVLEAAVLEAISQGVIVVVAAGNDGDRWAVDFPGDVPGVVAVSALGIRGRPAGFTNGRRPFTIFAPGVKVIGPWPGATWAQATGTSFAAPFASGAAALLRQAQPGANSAVFRARIAPRLRLDLHALWR